MTTNIRTRLEVVEQCLVKSGWTFAFSSMSDTEGLNYGSCFIKNGCKLYLNEDTLAAYEIVCGI